MRHEALLPAAAGDHGGHDHGHDLGGHPASHETHGDHEDHHGAADGIEWEDDMVEVNRATTRATVRWNLVDRDTGAVNDAIDGRSASATG